MSKEYDKWNEVKKELALQEKKLRLFKQRDIFFISMGYNVGFEQNGKGEKFVRPVVILKKITNDMFLAVPLSTKIKEGSWFYTFSFIKNTKEIQNSAIIPQIRMFSAKRLLNKIGVIPKENFVELQERVKNFIV